MTKEEEESRVRGCYEISGSFPQPWRQDRKTRNSYSSCGQGTRANLSAAHCQGAVGKATPNSGHQGRPDCLESDAKHDGL